MTTRHLGPRARTVGIATAVVLAGGVAVAVGPASADDSSSNDGNRHALRQDVKDARKLTGDDRRDALKKIREKARDGEYGDGVERHADRRAGRHQAFEALLPDDMQSDLKKARDEDDATKRKAMLKDIREKALAGGYGDKVKQAYEILKKNRAG